MTKEIVEEMVQTFRSEVERLMHEAKEWVKEEGEGGLSAWEERVRDRMRPMQARILQEIVQEVGRGYQGGQAGCTECGQRARYVGDRALEVHTVVGDIPVRRAYYHCKSCGKGFCVLDEKLGIGKGGWSPGMQRLMSLVGAVGPFEKATDLLWEIGRIEVSGRKVEAVTEQEGEAAQAWLRKREEEGRVGLVQGEDKPVERIYGLADGAMVLTREEKWKEVKLGAVFKPQGKDEQGQDQPGPIQYTGGILEVAEFAGRWSGLMKREGAQQANEVVILGDGALWIGNHLASAFAEQQVVHIVDWYHAQERLWRVAHAMWGEGNEEATHWAEKQKERLWEGAVGAVVEALRKLKPKRSEVRTLVKQSIGYYQQNELRMRYAQFRRKGYCIGSGVIESACKHVLQQRLKQAGMRWNKTHAEKVLALRLVRASGLWEEFQTQRGRLAA